MKSKSQIATAAVVMTLSIGWRSSLARSAEHSPAPHTRVVMLGTGTPNADPERSGPAVAIVVGDRSYIVDAGAGIVRRAAAASMQDSMPALKADNLRIVFLTHLHSDHTIGLPDVMLSPWVLGRTVPLEVFGPPGTSDMIANLSPAYAADIDIRLHGGEPSNKTGYRANAHEVKNDVIYRDSLVTVTAFEVAHGKWPVALGYKFVTADRTIVISGDTRPSQAVIDACNGCDVLVHEVYSLDAFRKRTADWQAYHSSYHTSTSELAAIATKARPKLLVLYHQLYWGDDDEGLLRQIRAAYPGAVVSGKDLAVY